jgi:DNA-binding transcriptional LysR family regulator
MQSWKFPLGQMLLFNDPFGNHLEIIKLGFVGSDLREQVHRGTRVLRIAQRRLPRYRGVTGAARQQGVSQPTMSEHLRRLRSHFGDRLFVPGPLGMQATERAEEIRPVAERVVADLDVLGSNEVQWDCRSAHRRFRILASVYAQTLLLPGLDKRLRQEAPGVRLHVEPAAAGCDPDAVDVAIWPINVAPQHHRTRVLFSDRLVCVFDPGVAADGDFLDLETFCSFEHILFAPAPSPLHDALARVGS